MGDPLFSGALPDKFTVPGLVPHLRLAAALCPSGEQVDLTLHPDSCRELARWIEAHEKLSQIDADPQAPAGPVADLGDWPQFPLAWVSFGRFNLYLIVLPGACMALFSALGWWAGQ